MEIASFALFMLAFLNPPAAARVELRQKVVSSVTLLDPSNPSLPPCFREDASSEECVNGRDFLLTLTRNVSVCDRILASIQVKHVKECLDSLRVQPEVFKSLFTCGTGFLDNYKDFRRSPLRGGDLVDEAPLQPLQSVAQQHAEKMAKAQYAGHDVLGAGGLLSRVNSSGWTGFPIGENVAKAAGVTLKEVVGMWMCSSSNRQNLMSCAFDTVGIGLSVAKSGNWYMSANFGCTAEDGKCHCADVKLVKELPERKDSDRFLSINGEIAEQSQEIPEVIISEPQIAADPENPILARCVQNTTIQCLNARDTIVPQSADLDIDAECPDASLNLPGLEFKHIANQIEQCINAYRIAPNAFEDVLPCGYTFRDEVSFPPRTPLRMTTESDGSPSHPLDMSAAGHSQDMASNNYFDHGSLDGRKFSDRILAQGWKGYPMAENIAAGYQSVRAAVLGWVCSPGHRKNLMSCGFDIMGTGVGFDSGSKFKFYYTQNFGCSDPRGDCKCGQIGKEPDPAPAPVPTMPSEPQPQEAVQPPAVPDRSRPTLSPEQRPPSPEQDIITETRTFQDLYQYILRTQEYTGLLKQADFAGIFSRRGVYPGDEIVEQSVPESIEGKEEPNIIGDPLIRLKPNTTIPPRCLENPDKTCRATPVHKIALVDPDLMCDSRNITELTTDESKIAEKVEICVNAYRTDPDAFAHMLPCDYDFRAEVNLPPRGPLQRPNAADKMAVHPLVSFAVDHSLDMALDTRPVHFGHDGSGGKSLVDRIAEANITMFPLGELIAAGKQSVQSIVMGWVCSPAHRQLLMSCGFDSFGTGVSIDPFAPLGTYVTQAYACSRLDGQCKCKDETQSAKPGSCAVVSSALPDEDAPMSGSPIRNISRTGENISMSLLNAAPHAYDCIPTTIAQNVTIGILMDSPFTLTKQDFMVALSSEESHSVHLEPAEARDTQNWILVVKLKNDFTGYMNVTMISSSPQQVLRIKKLTKSDMIKGLQKISKGLKDCL